VFKINFMLWENPRIGMLKLQMAVMSPRSKRKKLIRRNILSWLEQAKKYRSYLLLKGPLRKSSSIVERVPIEIFVMIRSTQWLQGIKREDIILLEKEAVVKDNKIKVWDEDRIWMLVYLRQICRLMTRPSNLIWHKRQRVATTGL